MEKYKIGDKLICVENIKNVLGNTLFSKGEEYEILHVIHDKQGIFITLNHVLFANEYNEFTEDFVLENFKTIKEIRKDKLNKIKTDIIEENT